MNITQSEIKYGTSFNEVVDWEKIIKEKDDEIERQKDLLEQSKIQIDIDKNDLDRTILYKDQAILKLTSDLKIKINEINAMNDIIKNLEAKILEISKTTKILKKIKKSMILKGFITEKEFEELIE